MGKAIKTRKAKLVLLAPNIASLQEGEDTAGPSGGQGGSEEEGEGQAGGEASGSGSGLGCPAATLVALAAEREVPLVFALSRQRMGKVRGRSCVLLPHALGSPDAAARGAAVEPKVSLPANVPNMLPQSLTRPPAPPPIRPCS